MKKIMIFMWWEIENFIVLFDMNEKVLIYFLDFYIMLMI